MKRSALLSMVLLLGVPLAAGAGVVVDIEHQEVEASGQSSTGRLYLDKGKVKMVPDATNADEPEFIFQGDRQRILIVDHERKSTMSIDAETLRGLSEQLQAMQKQMQEALAQLPDEQRQAAEQMMKQRMPAGMGQAEPRDIEVVTLDGTVEKEGRPCRGHEVRVDDELVSRFWTTDWKNVDLRQEDFQPFADMAAFFEDLLETMPMMAQTGTPDLFSGHADVQGFPVLVESLRDGEVIGRTFFRNARRQDLDATMFEAPEGYREQSMQEQMRGG